MNYERQIRLLRQYRQIIPFWASSLWNNFKKYWFLYLMAFIIVSTIYSYHKNFPEHLRYIEPAEWKSHQSPILDQHIRSLGDIKPKIFNNTLISICQDLEMDSDQNLFCINQDNQIVKFNTKTSVSQKIFTILKGNSYGIRLSKDQKYLYFANSELGLCEFDIKKKKMRSLASEYQGQFLMSLNGVEVHPQNQDLIYVTQSSKFFSMERFSSDIFLGNPFGRVFLYNKQKQKISLLADQLYFPNGIVFQKYKDQDTLLISQTSRFRVSRVYLEDTKKGNKQVAIDKLNIYPDNIKINEEGQLLIGAMGIKYPNWLFFSQSKWMRLIYSRFPTLSYSVWVGTYQFGGLRIKMDEKGKKPNIEYLLWNHFKNYNIVSTILQKNGNLFLSSFQDQGVIMIENFNKKLKTTDANKARRRNGRYYLTANATGYYEGRDQSLWNSFKDCFEWSGQFDD